MKAHRLVVKTHAPWKTRAMWAAGSVLMLLSGAGLYFFGEHRAGYNQVSAVAERSELADTIADLKRERTDLRDQIALLERSNQVDKQAYSEVDDNLKALQEEILELREEVTFYRGIVAPAESSAGLRIERFKVDKQGGEDIYHYNLVLTQVLKNDKTISGSVKVTVNGVEGGQIRSYPLERLSSQPLSREFSFRYFEKFEGDIRLPEGFSPRTVMVDVSPQRNKPISRTFDWPEVSAGAAAQNSENS